MARQSVPDNYSLRRDKIPGKGLDAKNRVRKKQSELQDWLNLLRWKNLLIVFGTQALAWVCVVWPLRDREALLLQPGLFFCLAVSTVCIAGAGYLINDYFDIKIDAINRPGKAILENPVHRRRAIIVHTALNGLGMLLAGIVAHTAGKPQLLFWQIGTIVLLWFYSTHFKRAFVIGNLVVSLMTALTVALLIFYEPVLMSYGGAPAFTPRGTNPFWLLTGFSLFAFLLTWMREIVKDAEDLKGDAEEGCDTMPIRWGLLRAVRFTQGIATVAGLALIVSSYLLAQAQEWLGAGWLLCALLIPLTVWTLRLPGRADSAHYATASRGLKILMLLGLITLLLL
jgi:4-hydroxybenzoate polyprenyltransferase